jgi:hypothetical protein
MVSAVAEEDVPADRSPVTPEEKEVSRQVIRLLRRVRYGTILLVVQDGKVVQIELAEKFRLR